jgi:RNA polymerase-binding transcription factor DksA
MPEQRKDTAKPSGGDEANSWSAVRQRLVDRRHELLERVRAVEKDLERESDPTSADWNERASQRSNDEVLSAIGEAGERELQAINLALRRIELGTYGTCARCGKPIAAARLRALPHVDCCEACAD